MAGLGLVVALAGIATLFSRAARQPSFGWFAYSPVSADQLDGFVVLNAPRLLGAGLVLLGLLAVALAAGLHIGRRGATRVAVGWVVGALVVGALDVVSGLVAYARPRLYNVTEADAAALLRTDVLLLVPGQVVALGVAALGLVLLAITAGLTVGGRVSASRP